MVETYLNAMQTTTEHPHYVSVTHPYHPMRGQKVEVVYARRGINALLIVRTADGRTIQMPFDWTDYLGGTGDNILAEVHHLLDLNGLLEMVKKIKRFLKEGCVTEL